MTTQFLDLSDNGTIAFDDTGGDGPLVVMLPGAGDVRAEYRFVAPALAASDARVVTMDLRGHGESSADWPSYGMVDTADGGPDSCWRREAAAESPERWWRA